METEAMTNRLLDRVFAIEKQIEETISAARVALEARAEREGFPRDRFRWVFAYRNPSTFYELCIARDGEQEIAPIAYVEARIANGKVEIHACFGARPR